MNPKRRRRLAAVAIVVLVAAGVLAFLALQPEDPPHLRLVNVEQQDGHTMAIFQFQAPKYKGAMVGNPRTVSPATGIEKPIQPAWDSSVIVPTGGESTGIRVLPPVDPVWRLRCDATLQRSTPKGLVERLRWCWGQESLAPLQLITRWDFAGKLTLESELLTNAVPTTETPAK